MGFAQSYRPIEGAVATVGVNERVAFLRRTYSLLGVSLVAFAILTAAVFHYAAPFSLRMSVFALSGYNWLAVIALFTGCGYLARHLAMNSTSKGLQYLGLVIEIAAYSFLFQPLLWVLFTKFGGGGDYNPNAILGEAVVITLAVFIGLTLTVFITGKDFSFLRSVLVTASFAALGVIVASIIFGFSLGALFSGLMILLMAGYILQQTSGLMRSFPPTYHVAAALMLFSTIATLFWYVLRLLMQLNRR